MFVQRRTPAFFPDESFHSSSHVGSKWNFPSPLSLSMQQTSQVCSPARSDSPDQNNKHTFGSNRPSSSTESHTEPASQRVSIKFGLIQQTSGKKFSNQKLLLRQKSRCQWTISKLPSFQYASHFFKFKTHV